MTQEIWDWERQQDSVASFHQSIEAKEELLWGQGGSVSRSWTWINFNLWYDPYCWLILHLCHVCLAGISARPLLNTIWYVYTAIRASHALHSKRVIRFAHQFWWALIIYILDLYNRSHFRLCLAFFVETNKLWFIICTPVWIQISYPITRDCCCDHPERVAQWFNSGAASAMP